MDKECGDSTFVLILTLWEVLESILDNRPNEDIYSNRSDSEKIKWTKGDQ